MKVMNTIKYYVQIQGEGCSEEDTVIRSRGETEKHFMLRQLPGDRDI